MKTLLCALLVLLGLGISGCPKHSDVTVTADANGIQVQATDKDSGASISADIPMPAKEEGAGTHVQAEAVSRGVDSAVYFDFNSAVIKDSFKPVLAFVSDAMKSDEKLTVRIEGNCDERGTKEYNQALGQRRADAAKNYLAALGISKDRITTVSYGKELLACFVLSGKSGEDCHQLNRRDVIVEVRN